MAFTYEIPVRFADVDRAGILYYPRFLNYFHITFEEWFNTELRVPYAEAIQRDHIGFPMRHLDVDFRGPLPYGDTAIVTIHVAKVGRTSTDFLYEVTSKLTGKLTTIARATTVCVNLTTFEPVPVPEPIRALFAARLDQAAAATPTATPRHRA